VGKDEAALRSAQASLARAARRDPGRSGTWYLLGTVTGYLGEAGYPGEGEEAVGALRRGVFVDAVDPLRRYATGEVLFAPGRGPGDVDWAALQRVYHQWVTRYPRRAEWYVASAIAACEGEGDREGALARIAQGRAAGAEPEALLATYHGRLSDGGTCPAEP
jgi:hypothetical protein